MNPLFDLLTKSELALELDASIAELNAKQARIDAQTERIKALEAALATILNLCDSYMGEWESVMPPYLPEDMMPFFNIREEADYALVQKGGGNG